LATMEVPRDLDAVLDAAWAAARNVPGYLMENEARLLGIIAACAPAEGAIVEIGSFKGKSTVMLAKVAEHYGLGSIVAIDPHNSPELLDTKADPGASSFQDFLGNIEAAGVASQVEVHRAYSKDVSNAWDRPIRFLWIDGDHTYRGAKTDFDGFFSHVAPGGIVALHDALNVFFRAHPGFCRGYAAQRPVWRGRVRALDCLVAVSAPGRHAVPPAAGSTGACCRAADSVCPG